VTREHGSETAPVFCTSRQANLRAILASLTARGVLYDLIEGVFRYCDEAGVLSEAEEIAIDICRPGLTEILCRDRGLCISCGYTEAVRPDYGRKVGAHLGPLWCKVCYHGGAWKEP
jgi:hypothetical protein